MRLRACEWRASSRALPQHRSVNRSNRRPARHHHRQFELTAQNAHYPRYSFRARNAQPVQIRPANLNRGVYKGGRRPLDIFWRIAKGINGAQMPAHYPSPLDDKKVWDLVNFVLTLPYEPELLRDAPPAPAAPAAVTASLQPGP